MEQIFKKDIQQILKNITDFSDRLCLLHILIKKGIRAQKKTPEKTTNDEIEFSLFSKIKTEMAKFEFLLQKQCKETFSSLIDILISTFVKEKSANWVLEKIKDFELKVANEKNENQIEKNFGRRNKTIREMMKEKSDDDDDFENNNGIYMGVLLRKRKFFEVFDKNFEIDDGNPVKKLKVFGNEIDIQNRKNNFEEDKIGFLGNEKKFKEEFFQDAVKKNRKKIERKIYEKKNKSLISSFRKNSRRLRKRVGKILNPTLMILEEKEKSLFMKRGKSSDHDFTQIMENISEKPKRAKSLGNFITKKKNKKKLVSQKLILSGPEEVRKENFEVESGEVDPENLFDIIEDHFKIEEIKGDEGLMVEEKIPEKEVENLEEKIDSKENEIEKKDDTKSSEESKKTHRKLFPQTQVENLQQEEPTKSPKIRSSSRLKLKKTNKKKQKELSNLKKIEEIAEKTPKSRSLKTSSSKKNLKKSPVFDINREKNLETHIQTLFINQKGQIQKGPLVEKNKIDIEQMYNDISKDKEKILNSENPGEIIHLIFKMKDAINEIKTAEKKREEIIKSREISKKFLSKIKDPCFENFDKENNFCEKNENSLKSEKKIFCPLKENLGKNLICEKIDNHVNYSENPNYVLKNKNFELLSSSNSKSFFSYSPINYDNSKKSEILTTPIKKISTSKIENFEEKIISEKKSNSSKIEKKFFLEDISLENKNEEIFSEKKNFEKMDISTPVLIKKSVRFSSALAKPYIDTADKRIAKYPESSKKIFVSYFSPSEKTKLKKIFSIEFLQERSKSGIICSETGTYVFTFTEGKKDFLLKKLKIPSKELSEYKQCLNFGFSKVSIILDNLNYNVIKVGFEGFTKISSSSDFKNILPYKLIKINCEKSESGVVENYDESNKQKIEKLGLLGKNGKILILGDLRANCRLEVKKEFSISDLSSVTGKYFCITDFSKLIFSKKNFFSCIISVNIQENVLLVISSKTGIVISKSYISVKEDEEITKLVNNNGITVVGISSKIKKKLRILKIYKYFPELSTIKELIEIEVSAPEHSFSLITDETFLDIIKIRNKIFICLAENYGKLLKMLIDIGDYENIGSVTDRIKAFEINDMIKNGNVELYIEEKKSVKRQKNHHVSFRENGEIWSFGNFGFCAKLMLSSESFGDGNGNELKLD